MGTLTPEGCFSTLAGGPVICRNESTLSHGKLCPVHRGRWPTHRFRLHTLKPPELCPVHRSFIAMSGRPSLARSSRARFRFPAGPRPSIVEPAACPASAVSCLPPHRPPNTQVSTSLSSPVSPLLPQFLCNGSCPAQRAQPENPSDGCVAGQKALENDGDSNP